MLNEVCLLLPPERAALHEARRPSLGERDIDDIEVPGHDRLGEDGPRLPRDLGPEVPVRHVGEDEHLHAGGPRELGRGARRRVTRLFRPLPLLVGEGAVVDQDLSLVRQLEDRGSRPCVARQDHRTPRPGRAEDLLGPHDGPALEDNGFATLEGAEERSLLDPEDLGGGDVEPARPRRFNERVPVRGDPVLDAERDDSVVAPVDDVAGPQLDESVRVGQLSEDPLEGREEIGEPRWPVDGERGFAAAQGERLHHPREAEVVVRVVVAEEDLRKLEKPDPRAQELALRALPAVEEQPVAGAPEEGR